MTREEIEKIVEAIDSVYDLLNDVANALEDEVFCGDEEREHDALGAVCLLALGDMNTHRRIARLVERIATKNPKISRMGTDADKELLSNDQTPEGRVSPIKTNPLKS